MTMLNDDDIALAGEYVLGLLDPAAQAQIAARIATDAAFADEVHAWRERLAPMLAGEELPPTHLWDGIRAKLLPATGQDVGAAKVTFWRTMTVVSAGAAAILGILLLQKPDMPAPVTAQAPVIAALGSEGGEASLTASYDKNSGQMLITPVSLDTGDLYPELWVIPADGTARSLGLVDQSQAQLITVPADMRQYLDAGGTLAITPEPSGGAPGGKATGPVIASGKLTVI